MIDSGPPPRKRVLPRFPSGICRRGRRPKFPSGNAWFSCPLLFFWGLFFFTTAFCFSGGNKDKVKEVPLQTSPPAENPATANRPSGGGVADEIRSLTESGVPSSLLRALDLIRSRDLGSGEFGRIMTVVNTTLIQRLYPDMRPQIPNLDPPPTHVYARILREAERGNYTPPSAGSKDYLEYVLPFLVFYLEAGSGGDPARAALPADRLLSALPDLLRASELNGDSVLAPYFLGIVYERAQRIPEARVAYNKAYDLSRECYPAVLGLARILNQSGQKEESLKMLSDLVIRYPDNITIKRQLALAYYQDGDWSRAEPAIAEILQRDSRDGEFILMRAHVLVEQGQFPQAQAPLDLYASINPNNRLYLFLRARVQAEGYRNRDAALNYLRSILRSSAAGNSGGGSLLDDEVSVYAVRLLMESSRIEDQNEGRDLLRRLMGAPNPSLAVINLAIQDAVRRENWREAQGYLSQLLAGRRSPQVLLFAYTVERGLGNNAAALSYARELYEGNPQNDEAIAAYISALIDTGRQGEAGSMIETRLASASGGAVKSRYYYLRSRIRTNEDAVMADLRSSLFEDPRNLNALIAMFEYYHRRRDERRAVYYLKQALALALAPDNPQLKRYETEYAAALRQ